MCTEPRLHLLLLLLLLLLPPPLCAGAVGAQHEYHVARCNGLNTPFPPRPRSYYALVQSAPSMKQYFFVYKVRIANEGSATVQLLSRHWVISDGDGPPSHVRWAAG